MTELCSLTCDSGSEKKCISVFLNTVNILQLLPFRSSVAVVIVFAALSNYTVLGVLVFERAVVSTSGK